MKFIKNILIIVSVFLMWMNVVNGEQKKDVGMTIPAIVEVIRRSKCNEIILVPMILGGKNDPFANGENLESGAADFSCFLGEDVGVFISLLGELKPEPYLDKGDQYHVIFLFDDMPTSSLFKLCMRKSNGNWYLFNNNGRYQLSDNFKKWVDGKMCKIGSKS